MLQWLRIRLAGDASGIPGQGTEIPHVPEQLNPLSFSLDSQKERVCGVQ